VRYREVANREVADPVSVGLRWVGGAARTAARTASPAATVARTASPAATVARAAIPAATVDWPNGAGGLPGGAAVTAGGAVDLPCGDVREEKGFAPKYQHGRSGRDGR